MRASIASALLFRVWWPLILATASACGGSEAQTSNSTESGGPDGSSGECGPACKACYNQGGVSTACILELAGQLTCIAYFELPLEQLSYVNQQCGNGRIVASCPTRGLLGCCEHVQCAFFDTTDYFYDSAVESDRAYCSSEDGIWISQ
jgi:hypothetical protein